MPRTTRRRLHAATEALSRISAEPWDILPSAMQVLLSDLMEMARSGRRPSARATRLEPEANSGGQSYKAVGSVAVIEINGIIRPRPDFYTRWLGATACTDIIAAVTEAANNESISKIVLWIDSPGGSVLGVQEAFDQIYILRNKKTIEALAEGVCASAAYYIACGAERIHATSSSEVGSTGCMMVHYDYSEMLKLYGIDATHIQFGKHKTDGSPWKPLDAQGRATLQEIVDDYGGQFWAAIAKGRGISVADVRAKYGEGKMFIAPRALANGMIDSVTDFARLCKTPAPQHSTDQQQSEDTTAANSSPAAESTPPAPDTQSPPTPRSNSVDPRIKAMLFGLGLIPKADASDDVANVALRSFCHARGVAIPESVEATVTLLTSAQAQQTTQQTQTGTNANGQGNATPPADPSATAMAQARQMNADVRAAAALINAGRPQPLITAEMVDQGVDAVLAGNSTLTQLQASWQQTISTDQQQQALRPNQNNAQGGQSGEDVFARNAVLIMSERLGCTLSADESRGIDRSMRSMSMYEMAEACAKFQGMTLTGATREERVLAMLESGGRIFFGGEPSANRPADFPHLLGQLAGRILDSGYELTEATFDRWTAKMADVADLLPRTVVAGGAFTDMDEIGDDEEPKQLKFSEELKGFVQASRYANKAGLTPVMVANDAMDSFAMQLRSLAAAHDLKLNRLAVKALTANAALPDGVALFDAAHGNVVASGGAAPSATEHQKMVLLHRKQTGIGTDVTISSRPRLVLVPSDLEMAARQTYLPLGQLPEVKMPTADSSINVYRGTIEDIIVEPMLDAFSTKFWYTFDLPTRIRVLVHVFQAGYGRGGRRESWFDPGKGTRYFKLEGRFGVGVVGFRGAARNKGEA